MAFFDDLSRTLTDMGRDAAHKTRDVVDGLQMKAQISSEKSRLRDLYAVIGKNYYEQHQEEAEEGFCATCLQIREALEKIADLEEKISRLDNTVTCPVCGAVLDKSAAYCSKCGATVASCANDKTEASGTDADIQVTVGVVDDVIDEPDGIFVEEEDSEAKQTEE